jgi:PAS domain S-box-containing protein
MPENIAEIATKVVDNVDVMLGYWDRDLKCRFANAAYQVWFGKSRQELLGTSMQDLLGPLFELNLPFIKAALNGEVQVFERTIQLPDGKVRHSLASYYPDIVDGEVHGFTVQVTDVTRLKDLECALQEAVKRADLLTEWERSMVPARLLQAQEQERTRIARDLHDDISQQLALVAIELGRFAQAPPESRIAFRDQVAHLIERVSQIARDVGAISRELHSSRLEMLGLRSAVRSLCERYANHYKVGVDFSEENLAGRIPNDISICLFRIAQEALRNGMKHSHASQFVVRLKGTPSTFELSVSDNGVGFDPEAIDVHRGLGLVSMRERLTLVRGTLEIKSKIQSGTEIRCSVPRPSEGRS